MKAPTELTQQKLLRFVPLQPFLCSSEIVFPYYHVVSDDSLPHIRHLYAYRNVAKFERDLDIFLKFYNPLELSEVVKVVNSGRSVTKPAFHLTFDDGFRECHDIIVPILKRKGIPATFFVCTDFIDNAEMYYRNKISILLEETKGEISANQFAAIKPVLESNGIANLGFRDALKKISFSQGGIVDEIGSLLGISIKDYLCIKQPYLTTEQVKCIVSDGFSVGSHSRNHVLFSELPLTEQLHQVRDSLDIIHCRYNSNCRAFAFPHNDTGVSRRFYKEVTAYSDICFGTARLVKDCVVNSLQRFSMESRLLECDEILKKNYLLKIVKRLTGKRKIQRKEC